MGSFWFGFTTLNRKAVEQKAPEIMFETRAVGGVQSLRVSLSKVTINNSTSNKSHSLFIIDLVKVSSEYLQFDDEDQDNANAHSLISPYGPSEDLFNNRIYYCYYQPSKIL